MDIGKPVASIVRIGTKLNMIVFWFFFFLILDLTIGIEQDGN